MSALSIQVPFPIFAGTDGQPLENGYVWIGVANLNPQTNPVVAYYDAALTIPAAQPLRTLNGYISRAGSPAQVYVDGVNFSILVQNSKGSMVYNFPDGSGISPNAAGIVYDPAGTGAVPTTVQAKLRETVSVKDFGAVGNGVTDDADAILAAITASNRVYFPAGTYYCSKTINLKKVVLLEGDAGTIVGTPEQWPTVIKFADNVVGFFVHRSNTNANNAGVPVIEAATTGADGSIFRNLRIIRGDATMPAAYNGKHGFWVKARCLIEDCLVTGFGGEGIYVAASAAATTDPLLLGNANNFAISRTRSSSNAGRGVYILGADANVGFVSKVDSSSNGRQGFLDSAFLGTTLISCHTAGNGAFSQVHYAGNRYYCRSDTLGASTTPGTNDAVWYLIGAGGVSATYPEWSSANTYYRGSAFESTNINSPSVYVGCYEEGSQPPSKLAQRTLSISGAWNTLELDSTGTRIVSDATDGLRSLSALTSRRNDSSGNNVSTTVGGDADNGDIIRSFNVDNPLGWRLRFNGADVDYRYSNLAAAVAYAITGVNTAVTLGSSGTKPYFFTTPRFGLGSGSNARQQTYDDTIPTTGSWGRGAIVWNINASSGGFAGWICVTAGTPGTWETFGVIS